MNFDDEVNAMTSAYAIKLGLITQKTYVEAEKIDGTRDLWYSLS